MSYYPVDKLKVTALSQVKGPAIFWRRNPGHPAMLVTGEADAMLVTLEGEHAGECGRVVDARINGYAVEGISIEVEHSSQFVPALVDEPVGAIILGPGGVRISTLFKIGYGFEELRDFPVDGEPQSGNNSLDLGFKKWRAVIGTGQERRTVIEFEATRKGNR